MSTLTITAKGQITLKKDALQHLGLQPGDKVQVDYLPGDTLSLRPVKPEGSIESFIGMFKDKVTRTVSIEEMNQVIADGWAGLL
ncbi:MAG: AbrB/MazE/SpoVT family DNA-binding domain-containing protein [Propionibacteriaceae bacterium]|jgi:AbrB family looped-hinge helix DNA binding protein|nr:AbrB/MazE/SpoVT family DNA-binding domain-containing protein [Propionibacteriaceae bacterium]